MGKMRQICVDRPGDSPCKVPKGLEVDRMDRRESLTPIVPKRKKKKKSSTLKNWSKIQPLMKGNTYIENRMGKESRLATIGSGRALGR